jgi:hypothetical protein
LKWSIGQLLKVSLAVKSRTTKKSSASNTKLDATDFLRPSFAAFSAVTSDLSSDLSKVGAVAITRLKKLEVERLEPEDWICKLTLELK